MKKVSSIVCICLLLLGAHRVSGQELSTTIGTCCAEPVLSLSKDPTISISRNYYDILPNGTDRHSYAKTPVGVAGELSIQSNPVSPSDTEWLYWEAQPWIGVNNQFALDTMRLFVERFPTYRIYVPAALNYTGQIVSLMADTGKFIEQQPWIDQYNWLASVYTGDTAAWYETSILLGMAVAENYFNLNEDANLYWNIDRLYPSTSNTDSLGISFIRQYQSERGLDTTPFHIIQIPPVPYGPSAVKGLPPPSGFDLSVTPNPANQSLVANVTALFSAPATLKIYDALGHLVENLPMPRLQVAGNQINIDCSKLAAGNYYLRLAADETLKTVNVTIEH